MMNGETVMISALKAGDVIYRRHFEWVISMAPNSFYPGRCNLKTDKSVQLTSLTKEVFRVVTAQYQTKGD